MKAIMFPGQGCQRQGMGKYLYKESPRARDLFEQANYFLGRRITDVMFFGDELELNQTMNTQPAVFLFTTILALNQDKVKADIVAGHSLGEYSALVVNQTVSFEDGLKLVLNRALIAHKVCQSQETAMGAVIGLPDEYVIKRIDEIARETGEQVYVANFNGPGQIVMTGSKKGIRFACKAFKAEGAKKAVPLSIAGSFHSPYMNDAEIELGLVIDSVQFRQPVCPIVQCVDAGIHSDPDIIKQNLKKHITHSVQWTKMVSSMAAAGVNEYYESGPDDTLQKITARMQPDALVTSLLP